jgi:hypothetical protein
VARIHARSARKEIKDIPPSGARKPPALTPRPPSAGYGAPPEIARSQELTPVAAHLSIIEAPTCRVPVQDTPWTH